MHSAQISAHTITYTARLIWKWKRAEYNAASLRAISTITEASTNAAISQTVNAALTKSLQYATFTSCCHDVSLSAVLLACVMSSFSYRPPQAHRGGDFQFIERSVHYKRAFSKFTHIFELSICVSYCYARFAAFPCHFRYDFLRISTHFQRKHTLFINKC